MQIKYEKYKDFIQSLNTLYNLGGICQKKAERVQAILGRIDTKVENPFHGISLTSHGESRIDHCIKYDLNDGFRLVTIQDNSMIFLMFVGTHEHVEAWIKRNRGEKFCINKNNELDVLKKYNISDTSHIAVPMMKKSLLDELDDKSQKRFAEIIKDAGLFFDLKQFSFMTDDKVIEDFCKTMKIDFASDICNILMSIKKSDANNANKLIDILKGDSKLLGSLSKEEILLIKDGYSIKV